MRLWRIALIGFGGLLLVLGAVLMFARVTPAGILELALWLVIALVLHDGIIAPIVFGCGLILRKAGRRIPGAVLAILQGGVVIASIFSIIVLPEIYAKFLGARNPTVLPFDYGLRLALLWAAVAVATALAIAAYLVVTKRQKLRPPAVQS